MVGKQMGKEYCSPARPTVLIWLVFQNQRRERWHFKSIIKRPPYLLQPNAHLMELHV